MNMERFTQSLQTTLLDAQNTAIVYKHQEIGVEHLHYALVNEDDKLVAKILKNMGIDIELYKRDIEEQLKKIPMVYGPGASTVYVSRYVNEILIKAEEEAKKFKDEYISVEHVYLTMIDSDILPPRIYLENMELHTKNFYSSFIKLGEIKE